MPPESERMQSLIKMLMPSDMNFYDELLNYSRALVAAERHNYSIRGRCVLLSRLLINDDIFFLRIFFHGGY